MGEFRGDEYHTHEGRLMGCIIREIVQVETVPRARVSNRGASASRPGQPVQRDYELNETLVHWRLQRSAVLRPGMISFIHSEGGHSYRAKFIQSISHDSMRIVPLQLSGSPGNIQVSADQSAATTWNAQEVNSQESLESLGQLGVWQGPMVLVAVTTGAAVIVGFGPGAAVVGLGAPAATSTLTMSILQSAIANALSSFVWANFPALVQASREGNVGRFWQSNSYSFGDTLRQGLISGATNAVTAGLFHTPSGTVGFDAFLRHILGRVGNALASVLQSLIGEATNPSRPSEETIRSRIMSDFIVNITYRMLG